MPSFKFIGEEDFLVLTCFAMYSSGSHSGHVTWMVFINIHFPFARKLLMKFDSNWPSGFRGDV